MSIKFLVFWGGGVFWGLGGGGGSADFVFMGARMFLIWRVHEALLFSSRACLGARCGGTTRGWGSPQPIHLKPGHLKMAFVTARCLLDGAFPVQTAPSLSRRRFPCGISLERAGGIVALGNLQKCVGGFLLYKFWRIFPGIFLEDFSGHFFPQK